MLINELLERRSMTKYRLSRESGVPHTTINDICNGKTRLGKCSAETLYKLSKVLDVSMETFLEDAMEYRSSFEAFKSNVCHWVRDTGDMDFLIETLKSNKIREYFNKKWYPECLYLLAMVDYISRENGLPVCSDYDDLRRAHLQTTIYPSSVLAMSAATKSERPKIDSLNASIPEFKRFNIVEGDVRNVF